MHLLVARIAGQRHIVSRHTYYDDALQAWAQLDEAKRRGRLVILAGPGRYRNTSGGRLVEPVGNDYLAVRDALDPVWSSAPAIKLVRVAGGGTTDLRDLLPAVGSARGVHGHEGGWMFRDSGDPTHARCQRLPYQGWASWWYHAGSADEVVFADGRYRRIVPVVQILAPCDDCGSTTNVHAMSVEH